MNIVVRTYAGFEDILAREVNHITGITPNIGKRAVYLEGGKKEIYLHKHLSNHDLKHPFFQTFLSQFFQM